MQLPKVWPGPLLGRPGAFKNEKRIPIGSLRARGLECGRPQGSWAFCVLVAESYGRQIDAGSCSCLLLLLIQKGTCEIGTKMSARARPLFTI